MAQQSDGANLLDPFGVWKQARDANLDAWSKVMIDFVNSDAYARASGQILDQYLLASRPFQQTLEKVMSATLPTLNMPSRTELASIAERLVSVEMRLDDLDFKISQLDTKLGAILAAIHATQPAPAPGRPDDSAEAA